MLSQQGEREMFRPTAIIAIMSLLALGPTTSVAAEPETEQEAQLRLKSPNFARGGFYFGMEGLVAVENTENIGGKDRFITSGGFEMRIGHRHNRWFATEILGLYVHTFGGDVQVVPPLVLSYNFLAWGMYANQRVYLTKRRFQPFVGAGLGFLQIRNSEDNGYVLTPAGPVPVPNPADATGFSMIFNAGMEMYRSETVVFTLQANYNMQFGAIDDTDFITAGLGMQFY
jgi:hypothetical protein